MAYKRINILINAEIWKAFKIRCIEEEVLIQDKIELLLKEFLEVGNILKV